MHTKVHVHLMSKIQNCILPRSVETSLVVDITAPPASFPIPAPEAPRDEKLKFMAVHRVCFNVAIRVNCDAFKSMYKHGAIPWGYYQGT